MGRIYTTKMALRKALITVRLTIEPESGTPAPPSWLESQGEKYTPGWRHQTRRVAAGRSRLSRRPAVSKMSATWRTFFILLTPTQTPGVTPDNASPARRLCDFPSPALPRHRRRAGRTSARLRRTVRYVLANSRGVAFITGAAQAPCILLWPRASAPARLTPYATHRRGVRHSRKSRQQFRISKSATPSPRRPKLSAGPRWLMGGHGWRGMGH